MFIWSRSTDIKVAYFSKLYSNTVSQNIVYVYFLQMWNHVFWRLMATNHDNLSFLQGLTWRSCNVEYAWMMWPNLFNDWNLNLSLFTLWLFRVASYTKFKSFVVLLSSNKIDLVGCGLYHFHSENFELYFKILGIFRVDSQSDMTLYGVLPHWLISENVSIFLKRKAAWAKAAFAWCVKNTTPIL